MATDFQVRQAVRILRLGGIIVYPTDTIYGIGCDPFDAQAVARIAMLKQRPAGKSMILLASDREQLAACTDLYSSIDPEPQQPTTWIVPANVNCPPWLRHEDGTIAVRLTTHPLVSRLCAGLESAIISTSANISGRRPAAGGLAIRRNFHGMVDAILAGDAHSTGRASIIRHYSNDTVIRH